LSTVEREARAERFPYGSQVTLEELDIDPHPALARLRAHEPVSWIPALQAWLVTRFDLALLVLRNPTDFTVDDPRFSTAQVVGPSMLSLDGAEHARHRDPFARAYRLDAIRDRFTETVAEDVDTLLDTIEPDGRADLRRALAGPLAVTTMVRALGLEGVEPATVLGWYEAIVGDVTTITGGGQRTPAGEAAFDHLRKAVEPALATLADAGIDLSEAVSNASVLLFGGVETTEAMIATAILHVLQHPDQRAVLASEPQLLPNAVEESLRLEPAAATLDRYATADVVVADAPIPHGDLVSVSLAGANRDPAVFEEPEAFDIRRKNANRHLSFAQGPHVCLGMHLARLETRVALERVLERLPGLRLDPGRPSEVRGLVFRKPQTVDVVWECDR
jgi:cytochrome P450